jgi:hypothetical protein
MDSSLMLGRRRDRPFLRLARHRLGEQTLERGRTRRGGLVSRSWSTYSEGITEMGTAAAKTASFTALFLRTSHAATA